MHHFSLLSNCNQFILRNKGAHIHNKIVLCHDYHTNNFEYLPLGFMDGRISLCAFSLTQFMNMARQHLTVLILNNYVF